jgi:hypothetical protein
VENGSKSMKNKSKAAYDITTLQYDASDDGEAQKLLMTWVRLFSSFFSFFSHSSTISSIHEVFPTFLRRWSKSSLHLQVVDRTTLLPRCPNP